MMRAQLPAAGAIGMSSRRGGVSIASPRRALARCRAVESPADATSGGGADDLTERATGAMLGAMVGNVLGAPVWGDRHWQVTRRFPSGLTDFWRFDIGDEPVPFGHYTGGVDTHQDHASPCVAMRRHASPCSTPVCTHPHLWPQLS
jgi:hypothetical protein